MVNLHLVFIVLGPVSYRSYHSKRLAEVVCALLWLYVHMALLPLILQDALYYRKKLYFNPCFINAQAQKALASAVQIFVFDSVLVVMLLSYPIIFNAHRKRMRQRQPNAPASQKTEPQLQQQGQGRVAPEPNLLGQLQNAHNSRSPRNGSHGFRLLTMLTVSVTICWTPMLCYYTTIPWITVKYPWWERIGFVLFAMEAIIDPVVFVAAQPELRAEFRRLFEPHN